MTEPRKKVEVSISGNWLTFHGEGELSEPEVSGDTVKQSFSVSALPIQVNDMKAEKIRSFIERNGTAEE